jgi:hypothetical protein
MPADIFKSTLSMYKVVSYSTFFKEVTTNMQAESNAYDMYLCMLEY